MSRLGVNEHLSQRNDNRHVGKAASAHDSQEMPRILDPALNPERDTLEFAKDELALLNALNPDNPERADAEHDSADQDSVDQDSADRETVELPMSGLLSTRGGFGVSAHAVTSTEAEAALRGHSQPAPPIPAIANRPHSGPAPGEFDDEDAALLERETMLTIPAPPPFEEEL